MAHHHSTPTTELNEGSATALITLEGLVLFCFTEQSGYAGGFLWLDHPHGGHSAHEFSITLDGDTRGPLSSLGDGDISIEAVNPVRAGMHRFERDPFNRQTGATNHPNDFRWIIDAECEEMHGIDLQETNGSMLRRLFIDSGTVYAESVGPREFALIRVDKSGERCRFYGRLANRVGIAIECRDAPGSGINIRADDAPPIFLGRRPGAPHRIHFRNARPNPHEESDFTLYYEVMSDPRGHKYDFRQAVPPGDPLGHGDPCEGLRKMILDGMGLACDNVYLRDTSELP